MKKTSIGMPSLGMGKYMEKFTRSGLFVRMVPSRPSILFLPQTRSEEEEDHKTDYNDNDNDDDGNDGKDDDDDEKQEVKDQEEDNNDHTNINDDKEEVKSETESESSLTMEEGTSRVDSVGKSVLAPLLVKAGMLIRDEDDNPDLSAPVDRAAAMAASKESSRNLAGAHLTRPGP